LKNSTMNVNQKIHQHNLKIVNFQSKPKPSTLIPPLMVG
jgi:hypothetical protein